VILVFISRVGLHYSIHLICLGIMHLALCAGGNMGGASLLLLLRFLSDLSLIQARRTHPHTNTTHTNTTHTNPHTNPHKHTQTSPCSIISCLSKSHKSSLGCPPRTDSRAQVRMPTQSSPILIDFRELGSMPGRPSRSTRTAICPPACRS
jgi:hypothetical protein